MRVHVRMCYGCVMEDGHWYNTHLGGHGSLAQAGERLHDLLRVEGQGHLCVYVRVCMYVCMLYMLYM